MKKRSRLISDFHSGERNTQPRKRPKIDNAPLTLEEEIKILRNSMHQTCVRLIEASAKLEAKNRRPPTDFLDFIPEFDRKIAQSVHYEFIFAPIQEALSVEDPCVQARYDFHGFPFARFSLGYGSKELIHSLDSIELLKEDENVINLIADYAETLLMVTIHEHMDVSFETAGLKFSDDEESKRLMIELNPLLNMVGSLPFIVFSLNLHEDFHMLKFGNTVHDSYEWIERLEIAQKFLLPDRETSTQDMLDYMVHENETNMEELIRYILEETTPEDENYDYESYYWTIEKKENPALLFEDVVRMKTEMYGMMSDVKRIEASKKWTRFFWGQDSSRN